MHPDKSRALSASRRRALGALAAALLMASVAFVVGGSQVGAVVTPGAAYANFATPTGANPSWTTGLTMPGAAGFPAASIATNSLSPSVPSGASTWLSTGTPFGTQFASSQNQGYLNFSPTTGQAMSTTTITFASPTPITGWGFALGDVDAESIGVSATDESGAPVSAANLGFQSAFNLCDIPSPKPSTCSGVVTFDTPTWVPGSNTGVLQGNVNDTTGASAWFMPTVRLGTLTLTSTNLSGFPTASLWIASNLRTISGNISIDPVVAPTTTTTIAPAPAPVPVPDALVSVLDSTNTVVATTTTDANGDFSFPTLAPGIYTLVEEPPAGTLPPANFPLTVDVTYGNVTGIIVVNTPAELSPKFTG